MLDGRTLRLPGSGGGASAASRAEALRVLLEGRLGEDRFLRAYRRMQAVTAVRSPYMQRAAPRCVRRLASARRCFGPARIGARAVRRRRFGRRSFACSCPRSAVDQPKAARGWKGMRARRARVARRATRFGGFSLRPVQTPSRRELFEAGKLTSVSTTATSIGQSGGESGIGLGGALHAAKLCSYTLTFIYPSVPAVERAQNPPISS